MGTNEKFHRRRKDSETDRGVKGNRKKGTWESCVGRGCTVTMAQCKGMRKLAKTTSLIAVCSWKIRRTNLYGVEVEEKGLEKRAESIVRERTLTIGGSALPGEVGVGINTISVVSEKKGVSGGGFRWGIWVRKKKKIRQYQREEVQKQSRKGERGRRIFRESPKACEKKKEKRDKGMQSSGKKGQNLKTRSSFTDGNAGIGKGRKSSKETR